MATNKKKIEVNSASIVDLKAELFRKQEEVRNEKSLKSNAKVSANSNQFVGEISDDSMYNKDVHNVSKLPKKMLNVFEENRALTKSAKNKNPIPQTKIVEDLAAKQAEDLALMKSREMLEKKAKQYNQLASGVIIPDPENEDLLVNFEQKRFDNQYSSDSCDNEDEELVEFVDEFGRTRLVKRKDLSQYETDKDNNFDSNDRVQNHSPSNDAYSDNEQNERQDNSDKYVSNRKSTIHYEDVLEGEIRNHGPAFFNFSTEEEERAKQMENLENIRKETISKQLETKGAKAKKKQLLKDRMRLFAKRKGIEYKEENSEESESEPEEEIVIEKAKLPSNSGTTKVGKLRDWDIGKEGLFAAKSIESKSFISQERYVTKRREERDVEFAPPSIYNEGPSSSSSSYSSYKRFKPRSNNFSNFRREDKVPDKVNNEFTPKANASDIAALIGDKLSQIRKNLNS